MNHWMNPNNKMLFTCLLPNGLFVKCVFQTTLFVTDIFHADHIFLKRSKYLILSWLLILILLRLMRLYWTIPMLAWRLDLQFAFIHVVKFTLILTKEKFTLISSLFWFGRPGLNLSTSIFNMEWISPYKMLRVQICCIGVALFIS